MAREHVVAAFLERIQPFVREAGVSLTEGSRPIEDRKGSLDLLVQRQVTC